MKIFADLLFSLGVTIETGVVLIAIYMAIQKLDFTRIEAFCVSFFLTIALFDVRFSRVYKTILFWESNMFSKLDVIAIRVHRILAKVAIRAEQLGKDVFDAQADKLDAILDTVPFALREKLLRKINKTFPV